MTTQDPVQIFADMIANLHHGQRLTVSLEGPNGQPVKFPRKDVPLAETLQRQLPPSPCLQINPNYELQDCDTIVVWHCFNERPGSRILEVGANEEATCRVLADSGYEVVGVDLKPHDWQTPHNYTRIEGDFVKIAPYLVGGFDAVISTSAVEHFGLPIYGFGKVEINYDIWTLHAIHSLLKTGGACYLTVPYGREFMQCAQEWRVYNQDSFLNRLAIGFRPEQGMFFLSGECDCPHVNGIVSKEDADKWSGDPPHVTCFVKLVKV